MQSLKVSCHHHPMLLQQCAATQAQLQPSVKYSGRVNEGIHAMVLS